MIEIKAQKRNVFGKKLKTLKKSGFIPAELYGHNISNIHLMIRTKDFNHIFKEVGGNQIINLVIEEESKKLPVLIHDVQKNYLNNEIIHIDFYQVKMDEKIKARIPLEFIGESPAVKNYGGVLNKSMHEIEVESLPQNLPPVIKVDISVLKKLGQTLYVKDLNLPPNIKILVEPETAVATITLPYQETVAETIDIQSVKVEAEEKTLERKKKEDKNDEEL